MKALLIGVCLLSLGACRSWNTAALNEEPEDVYEEILYNDVADYEVGPAPHQDRELIIQVGSLLTCGAHYENEQLSNIICIKGRVAKQCATQPLTCQNSDLVLPVTSRARVVFPRMGTVIALGGDKVRCVVRPSSSILCIAGEDRFVIR